MVRHNKPLLVTPRAQGQTQILSPASLVMERAPRQTRKSAQSFKVEGAVDSEPGALGSGLARSDLGPVT